MRKVSLLSLLCSTIAWSDAKATSSAAFMMSKSPERNLQSQSNSRRRQVLRVGAGGLFSGLPFFGSDKNNEAQAAMLNSKKKGGGGGATNEVVKIVKGMKHRRLGNSDIFVS